jgi:hypothetical protein
LIPGLVASSNEANVSGEAAKRSDARGGRAKTNTRPQPRHLKRIYPDEEMLRFESDADKERRKLQEDEDREDAAVFGDIWGGRSHV